MIAEYDIEGRRAKGVVVFDNKNSIRVWYKGQVITRKKRQHNVVMPCSVMRSQDYYYADPKGFAAIADKPQFEENGEQLH